MNTDTVRAPLGAPNRGPTLGLSGAPKSAPRNGKYGPLEGPRRLTRGYLRGWCLSAGIFFLGWFSNLKGHSAKKIPETPSARAALTEKKMSAVRKNFNRL